jgi:hypothetical protein
VAAWHEPTEREALEHLRDVLAAEVADDWILPTAMLYPADNGLGEGPNPIETRTTLAQLRDLASAVNAYGHQGWLWPQEVTYALKAAIKAGFNPYAVRPDTGDPA